MEAFESLLADVPLDELTKLEGMEGVLLAKMTSLESVDFAHLQTRTLFSCEKSWTSRLMDMQLSYFFQDAQLREMILKYSNLPGVHALINILKIIYLQNISLFSFRQKEGIFTQRREILSAFAQSISPKIPASAEAPEETGNILEEIGTLHFGPNKQEDVFSDPSSSTEQEDDIVFYRKKIARSEAENVGAEPPQCSQDFSAPGSFPIPPPPPCAVPAPAEASKETRNIFEDLGNLDFGGNVRSSSPQKSTLKSSFLKGFAWFGGIAFLGIAFVMILTPQVHHEAIPTPSIHGGSTNNHDETHPYYEPTEESPAHPVQTIPPVSTGTTQTGTKIPTLKLTSVCHTGNRYLSGSGQALTLVEKCENGCLKGSCVKLNWSLTEMLFKQSFVKILSEEIETGKYTMMMIIGFFTLIVLMLRELISGAIHKIFQALLLVIKWILAHTWGFFFAWISDLLFTYYRKQHTNQKILGWCYWLSCRFSLQEIYRNSFKQIYQEILDYEKLTQDTVESKQQILQEAKTETQDLRDETQ